MPALAGTVVAAHGRVYVAFGTFLTDDTPAGVSAFDAETGRLLWTRGLGINTPPNVAVTPDRVIAVVQDRIVGLDAATGADAWSQAASIPSMPVASDPDVLVAVDLGDQRRLRAIDTGTGRLRWARPIAEQADVLYPAVAGDRVLVADECDAEALDRRDGRRLWRKDYGCDSGGRGEPRISGTRAAIGSRVIALEDGRELFRTPPEVDALAGEVLAGPGTLPDGLADRAAVEAVTLDGRPLWRRGRSEAGGSVVAWGLNDLVLAARAGVVEVLDLQTGAVRWQGSVRSNDEAGIEDETARIPRPPVAGAGVVVLRRGVEVFAIAPAGRVPAPPLTAKVDKPVIEYGGRVKLSGRLGKDLGMVAPLSISARELGRRRDRALPAGETAIDGSFALRARPARFTRYTVGVPGAANRPVVPVFVVPRYSERIRRGRLDPNAITARVRVRVPRDVRARGRRLGLYLRRDRRGPNRRIAVTRLAGRRGTYRGTLRFRAVRLGRRDGLVYCVSGLVRQGLGIGDRLDRRCGARRVE